MSDLVAFLRARYDEREAAAKAATPGRWQAGGTYGDMYAVLPADHVLAPDYRPPGFSQGQHVADARVADGGMTAWAADLRGSGFPVGNARHIALNDPAFVLADIAAKRQILDMWEDPAWVEDPTLHPDVDPEHYQDGRDWNERDEQVAEANTIDQIVRLLAQPFRAHPDFDPAWVVDAP